MSYNSSSRSWPLIPPETGIPVMGTVQYQEQYQQWRQQLKLTTTRMKWQITLSSWRSAKKPSLTPEGLKNSFGEFGIARDRVVAPGDCLISKQGKLTRGITGEAGRMTNGPTADHSVLQNEWKCIIFNETETFYTFLFAAELMQPSHSLEGRSFKQSWS